MNFSTFRLFPLAVMTTALSGLAGRGLMAQQAALPTPSSEAAVTVSAQVAGRTPSRIGYNMGEDLPGSNVSTWLRYAEMNAARVWWPQSVWPANPAPWPANTQARFEAERSRLRAAPLAGFDWKSYEAGVGKAFGGVPAGTIGQSFMLSELKKMGAAPLVMMSRSTAQHPFDAADGSPDWFGRWSYWRGVYVNALYLARFYDVERFQLFNEPNHSANLNLQQPNYIRRLQIGSDAIQAALADANRLYGKSLRPQVSAPVTAGLLVFNPRGGRADNRDATTGWGELVMRHRKDDFPGRGPNFNGLFQVYAFQNYGRNPDRITHDLPTLRGLIAGANGGTPLPIIVSEMNVSTAADFAKTDETLNSPGYYAPFGTVAAAYVNTGIDEVYIFRLTQTANLGGGEVKKNGTHIIDNSDPLKNILASTKGAEAVRLFIRGFKGGRARFAAPMIAGASLSAAAARDDADGTHTLMVTNLGEARSVALDVSAWQLPVGALVTIEEVSEAHHGDVSRVLPLPPGGRLVLPSSANSIALITIRPTLSGVPRAVVPTTVSLGLLHVQMPPGASGRVLLALQANAVPIPSRVRVYRSSGGINQRDLLGQITLGRAAELLVDVTRYATAAKGGRLDFQLVAEQNVAAAPSIEAAQLRIYSAAAAQATQAKANR